ncbi:MAG: bifunctional tRNA (5-methylaminomethyl-2-thiouridine)(34)-methyltransferase MnmD/FAD-dependent 5-carboxymethylaminomethyl-2-thiouridine(34) oxidoreductase MnmC [Betaproteobacteria bacterium]
MNARLLLAGLAFDASGTPFSPTYGDVYHSAASGPGQARHVFLAGNDLPRRWMGAHGFCIVECGFGLGLNFLATWSAWRDDPKRCASLHYVSIERHPFRREDLATLHARYPEFAGLSASLRAAWPTLVPGAHRLHLEHGVTLTLMFADAARALADVRARADAFYLDGFAPEKNPDMWSQRVAKSMARLAKPGATLSTWSVARNVRDALSSAGFELERRPGFAAKRDMLAGRFVPRGRSRSARASAEAPAERHALVIGAGLAGCAVTERLAAHGWRVDLVERESAPATGASGVRAAVFQPHVSRDDCLLSRWTRAAFLYTNAQWPRLLGDADAAPWRRCGMMKLADGASNEERVADTAAQLGYPGDYARYVPRDAARGVVGAHVDVGGWWFAHAGYVAPAAIAALQLARSSPALVAHMRRDVVTLERVDGNWQARDRDGAIIARAPVVVLANASDALRLAAPGVDALAYPIRRVRGQQSYLPSPPFAAPRVIVGGDGYVLPADHGVAVIGATYDVDRDDVAIDAASHAQNLDRAERMLPGSTAQVDMARVSAGIGVRCVARDRMPIVGAMIDLAATRARADALSGAQLTQLRHLPRMPGSYAAFAYASRGATWALLAAELIASQLEGIALPVEGALADALDPGRFAVHQLRHGIFAR